MFYDCLFSAACQREYLPAHLQAPPPRCPHPTEDREAGTVEREGRCLATGWQGLLSSLLTISHSWEAKSPLEEGGPSTLVLPGLLRPWGRGSVTGCPQVLSVGERDPALWA